MDHKIVPRSSQQNPMSLYDNAIGQPHNPAHIGNFFTTFRFRNCLEAILLNRFWLLFM
jgi:hypothetical protein